MNRSRWPAIAAFAGATCFAYAAEVHGTVVVKRTLTKRKVTLPLGLYDRGPAVPLGQTATAEDGHSASATGQVDVLAAERQRVVIYLDEPGPAQALVASLEQKDRQFQPELIVVPAGSTVAFPNSDPIFHNVFSLSKPKSFDLGNYPKGQTRSVMFPKPGIVLVNCHLHANMAAVIVITPGSAFARASEDGRFLLRDVPDGEHSVVAWHKSAGFFRQRISVQGGHAKDLEFLIPLEETGTPIRESSFARK